MTRSLDTVFNSRKTRPPGFIYNSEKCHWQPSAPTSPFFLLFTKSHESQSPPSTASSTKDTLRSRSGAEPPETKTALTPALTEMSKPWITDKVCNFLTSFFYYYNDYFPLLIKFSNGLHWWWCALSFKLHLFIFIAPRALRGGLKLQTVPHEKVRRCQTCVPPLCPLPCCLANTKGLHWFSVKPGRLHPHQGSPGLPEPAPLTQRLQLKRKYWNKFFSQFNKYFYIEPQKFGLYDEILKKVELSRLISF